MRSNNQLDVYPCILDPITYLNVAKNSFRIDEIKEIYSKTNDFVNQSIDSYEKNELTQNSILCSILNISEDY